MSHRDLQERPVRLNSWDLQVALAWLLRGVNWSSVQLRSDCTWTAQLLATTALLWAWSDESTLVERFFAARRIAVHLCAQSGEVAQTYQAFTKILRRWTTDLVGLLQQTLRERMQRELRDCWLVLGFVMFGVDGSRAELPRTQSHEQAYSASRRKRRSRKDCKRRKASAAHLKKSNSPQLWLTTMWHAGTGLPWDWRIGPADSSERAHLLAMLSTLSPRGPHCRGRRLRGLRVCPSDHQQWTPLAPAGRSECPIAEESRVRSRVRKHRVFVAGSRGPTATAPLGVTTGRGAQRKTSRVPGDQHPFHAAAHGPANRRTVRSPLGHRSLLSPPETDFSAAQTSQRPCRERPRRDGVVAHRPMGDDLVRAHFDPRSWNPGATTERRPRVESVPAGAAGLLAPNRTETPSTRLAAPRRHGQLLSRKQIQSRLSTQKTGTPTGSTDNPRRLEDATPVGTITYPKWLTA